MSYTDHNNMFAFNYHFIWNLFNTKDLPLLPIHSLKPSTPLSLKSWFQINCRIFDFVVYDVLFQHFSQVVLLYCPTSKSDNRRKIDALPHYYCDSHSRVLELHRRWHLRSVQQPVKQKQKKHDTFGLKYNFWGIIRKSRFTFILLCNLLNGEKRTWNNRFHLHNSQHVHQQPRVLSKCPWTGALNR